MLVAYSQNMLQKPILILWQNMIFARTRILIKKKSGKNAHTRHGHHFHSDEFSKFVINLGVT